MLSSALAALCALVAVAPSLVAASIGIPLGPGDAPALQIPDTIFAGENTTWVLNLPRSNMTSGLYENMEIQLNAVPRDHEINGYPRLERYCILAPCIAMNVTSTTLTVPVDAFPYAESVVATINYYRSDEDTSFVDSGIYNNFLMVNTDASWSRYEQAWGWGIHRELPCEAVPCARSCITRHYDAGSSSQSREARENFDGCLDEECGVVRSLDQVSGAQCITSNSRAPPREIEDPGPSDDFSEGARVTRGHALLGSILVSIIWTTFGFVH